MGRAISIMALVFSINIAVGILTSVAGIPVSSLNYDATKGTDLNASMSGEIAGAPVLGTNNAGDKILDFFNLGIFIKLKTFINNYLLGMSNLISVLVGGGAELLAILNTLTIMIYVLGAIELFTGRRLLG